MRAAISGRVARVLGAAVLTAILAGLSSCASIQKLVVE